MISKNTYEQGEVVPIIMAGRFAARRNYGAGFLPPSPPLAANTGMANLHIAVILVSSNSLYVDTLPEAKCSVA